MADKNDEEHTFIFWISKYGMGDGWVGQWILE